MAFVFWIVVFFIDHYSAGGYLISVAYFSFHFIWLIISYTGQNVENHTDFLEKFPSFKIDKFL